MGKGPFPLRNAAKVLFLKSRQRNEMFPNDERPAKQGFAYVIISGQEIHIQEIFKRYAQTHIKCKRVAAV